MPWLARRSWRWFLLIAVIILANTFVTYWNIARLRDNEERVLRTLKIETALDGLLSTLLDIESGQRGYVITGQASYLDTYNMGVGKVPGELDELEQLTRGHAAQLERIDQLKPLIAAKLAELQQVIDLRSSSGFEAAQRRVLTNQGKQDMDGIRALIASMLDAENVQLAQHTADSQSSQNQLIGTMFLINSLSLVLLLAAVVLARREHNTREQAYAQAYLQREWLEKTLLSIGDAVITTDTDGAITLINGVAEALTGWTSAEAVGREHTSVFRIISEATRNEVESPVRKVLRDGMMTGLANHTILLAKDGREIPIDDSGAPIRDATGAVAGVVLVFRDISDRKRADQERERLLSSEHTARVLAESALQSRDAFLSVAAHELKTPLTTLLGNAQLLERGMLREGQADQREQRRVAVIVEQSRRLDQLIAGLLDVSRLNVGQLDIKREPLDLTALLARIVDEMPPLGGHTLQITGPAAPLTVLGDSLRLEQVFQNLLQNAIKYSPGGGEILVGLYAEHRQAVVSIQDRGIGIPEDAIPQLFDRFYRANDSRTQSISGMGVGLFVVKEIISLHHGTVSVASAEGGGSTFTVRLPLADTQSSPSESAHP